MGYNGVYMGGQGPFTATQWESSFADYTASHQVLSSHWSYDYNMNDQRCLCSSRSAGEPGPNVSLKYRI